MSTRNRVERPQPRQPFDDLKEFIGICAQVRNQLNPAALQQRVVEFVGGMDEDSKNLIRDLAGALRRPW